MLWTALGIGGIWIAVVLISLFAPDLVSGSEQDHRPVAAFTSWFWGGVGALVLLWAMSQLRGSATVRPVWIDLSVVTLALWAVPPSSPSRCPSSRPAPTRRRSRSPPSPRGSPRRCSPRSRDVLSVGLTHHEVKQVEQVIARVWRGSTRTSDADDYDQHYRSEVLSTLRGVPGFRGAHLLRRSIGDETGFVSVTVFETLDAARGFAGDDYEAAVVAEEARQALVRFGDRVTHYDVAFEA